VLGADPHEPPIGGGTFVPTELATSNYLGVFGTEDPHDVCDAPGSPCIGDGSFHLNRGIAFRDVSDGLSQTFLVGERSSKHAPGTWVGVLSGGEHAPARVVGVGAFPPNSEQSAEASFHNFSSFHPSGTNFLLGGGSVRLIAESIDARVYRALCTRAAGDVVGDF
jgi:hypothetical protein